MPATDTNLLSETFAEKIKVKFLDRKLFLDHRLKLGDMAAAIGTNRTYLSRYLNEEKGKKFYEFVNELRLEHAEKLIVETQMNLGEIAIKSGFNSYSTFRRAFTAYYKSTPSAYRLEHSRR